MAATRLHFNHIQSMLVWGGKCFKRNSNNLFVFHFMWNTNYMFLFRVFSFRNACFESCQLLWWRYLSLETKNYFQQCHFSFFPLENELKNVSRLFWQDTFCSENLCLNLHNIWVLSKYLLKVVKVFTNLFLMHCCHHAVVCKVSLWNWYWWRWWWCILNVV